MSYYRYVSFLLFFTSRRRHTRCALVTGVQTCALPISSIGFLVIGLSGNTRIHSLPPRLTKRVMQRRAASIWRAVSAPWVVAFRPYSPKLTRLEHWARPSLRPLNCLRYLVRLGCNMATLLTSQTARGGRHRPRDANRYDDLRHLRGAAARTHLSTPGRSAPSRRSQDRKSTRLNSSH